MSIRAGAVRCTSRGRPTDIRAGLLDELHLMVCPIVLGGGKRLFDDEAGRVPLRLTGSEAFPTGVAHLTYQPA